MSRISIPTVAVMLTLLSACSDTTNTATQSGATNSQASSAPPTLAVSNIAKNTPFKDLNRFDAKPPWDLVTDDVVGKVIRAIVPQSQFKCMDEIFNYMHDLELKNDGSVVASGNGSRADHFVESFISVSPDGTVHIVLNCDAQGDPKGKYQFFTNGGLSAPTPKLILDWMYVVGREGDSIVKSDGKEQVEVSYDTFLQSLLADAAKSNPAVVAATPSTTSTSSAAARATVSAANLAGSWNCQTRLQSGSVVSELYEFQPQGSFSSIDQSTRVTGSYEVRDGGVELRVLGATQAGVTVAANAFIDVQVETLTNQEFRFASVVRASGTKRSSACVKSKPEAVAKATEPTRSAANGQRGRFISTGSVICLSVRSFYKVNAIEMSGNQLASLPADCDYIGSDSQVNVLNTINDPVVGMVHLVGNAGGSGYVRMRDLR